MDGVIHLKPSLAEHFRPMNFVSSSEPHSFLHHAPRSLATTSPFRSQLRFRCVPIHLHALTKEILVVNTRQRDTRLLRELTSQPSRMSHQRLVTSAGRSSPAR